MSFQFSQCHSGQGSRQKMCTPIAQQVHEWKSRIHQLAACWRKRCMRERGGPDCGPTEVSFDMSHITRVYVSCVNLPTNYTPSQAVYAYATSFEWCLMRTNTNAHTFLFFCDIMHMVRGQSPINRYLYACRPLPRPPPLYRCGQADVYRLAHAHANHASLTIVGRLREGGCSG